MSELYEARATLDPLALETWNDACQWDLEEYATFVEVMLLQNVTNKTGDSCTESLGFRRLIWTYSISVLTYCVGNPGYKIDEEKHGDGVKVTFWRNFVYS